MRKRLTTTLALGMALAVVVAGLAVAAGNNKPFVVQKGNLKDPAMEASARRSCRRRNWRRSA